MTPRAAEIFTAAERLDESPMELLNGGANDALHALDASAGEIEGVAQSRGIEFAQVEELWQRASSRLRDLPEPDALYPAAAEAATLLYTAAWVLESDSVTTEDLRLLL
jgi:hypothetical protein